MNRNQAKIVMQLLLDCQAKLDDVANEIHNIEDADERIQYEKSIATIMADIFSEGMLKIIHQHPELNPYD